MSDLIKREDVLEIMSKNQWYFIKPREQIERINAIPTVEPKVGKWFDHSDEGYVQCPFCGSATTCEDNIDELHYCFNCGAKMEREKPKAAEWEQLQVFDIEDTTIDRMQSTYCPICHRYHTTPYIYSFNHYDYCPNCGTKMKRRTDE